MSMFKTFEATNVATVGSGMYNNNQSSNEPEEQIEQPEYKGMYICI